MAAKLVLALLSLTVLALAGCSGSNTEADVEIEMHNFAFDPSSVTIKAGERVMFHNHDETKHTATGTGFDTGDMMHDGHHMLTFDSKGTFAFHCKYHPTTMTGTVIVQ